MLDKARVRAQTMQDALLPYVEQDMAIVGLEPSCLLTLRDEHKALLPGAHAEKIAQHAKLFEEFLAEHIGNSSHGLQLASPASKILLHGHCHQKAFNIMPAVEQCLALLSDTDLQVIQSSCCGMAGAFGYMKDTVDVSEQMASRDLVPAVKSADSDTLLVASGTSCRHQIDLMCNQKPLHLVSVIARSILSN